MEGLGVEAFIWEGWNCLFYLGGFNGVEAFIWRGWGLKLSFGRVGSYFTWNYLFYLGGFNPPGGVGWITGGGVGRIAGRVQPPRLREHCKKLRLGLGLEGGSLLTNNY